MASPWTLYRRIAQLAALALLTASCAAAGGSPSGSPPQAAASHSNLPPASPGAPVGVILKEFSIVVQQQAAAGAVTFHVENHGTMDHELDIFHSTLPIDGLPVNSAQKVDESSAAVKIIEASVTIHAGESADIPVTLPPGSYYLVCNQPGHYTLGMRLEYVVP